MRLFFLFSNSISFYVLIYIIYKSEISWAGTNRDHYLLYFFVSIIFIILFTALLYLNKKIQQYAIIISCSIIFALYFFEFFLLKYSQPKNFNINYDIRTKLQIYEDIKKKSLYSDILN